MWNAAELAAGLASAPDYGFAIDVRGHDFARLKQARDAYIERLNGIYARNLQKREIVHFAESELKTSRSDVTEAPLISVL
jgi:glutathione reductase (NADPH)